MLDKGEVRLRGVRLAFPGLWTPQAFNDAPDAKKQYQATLIFARGSKAEKMLHAAAKQVGTEKWGDDFADPDFREEVTMRYCLDGNRKKKWDGFPGMLYVTAINPKRPLVIDRDKSPLVESDGRPYGGCFVNANIQLWAQDNKWGRAINASLLGVQFAEDGESFGGSRVAAADDFEDLEDTGRETADEIDEVDPLA